MSVLTIVTGRRANLTSVQSFSYVASCVYGAWMTLRSVSQVPSMALADITGFDNLHLVTVEVCRHPIRTCYPVARGTL